MDEDKRVEYVEISLEDIKTPKELQKKLKENLDFPDFYGMNWNAFWDAITGLVVLPEKIVFLGWDELENSLPLEANILKELLNSSNTQYPKTASEIIYK